MAADPLWKLVIILTNKKAAGEADHDQADWAGYFNKALLNTFYFVSDYVFVHGMAEARPSRM